MNGNETCVIALHYATCKPKRKQKKKRHFHSLYPLNLRLTPINVWPQVWEKCISVKGPLSLPLRSLCIVPLNNSKNVASAKVNIFYSDIPNAW